MTHQEILQIALGEIELSISKANFITWFKNTNITSNKEGRIVISVPNGFTREWLENKYNKLIIKALRNNIDNIRNVSYVIGPTPEETSKTKYKIKIIKKKSKQLELKEQLDLREYKK